MTDIREICSCCGEEFAPLSSARGEKADFCLRCRTADTVKANMNWPVHKPTLEPRVKRNEQNQPL